MYISHFWLNFAKKKVMNLERKLSLAPLIKLNSHLLILNLADLSDDQESLKLRLGVEIVS